MEVQSGGNRRPLNFFYQQGLVVAKGQNREQWNCVSFVSDLNTVCEDGRNGITGRTNRIKWQNFWLLSTWHLCVERGTNKVPRWGRLQTLFCPFSVQLWDRVFATWQKFTTWSKQTEIRALFWTQRGSPSHVCAVGNHLSMSGKVWPTSFRSQRNKTSAPGSCRKILRFVSAQTENSRPSSSSPVQHISFVVQDTALSTIHFQNRSLLFFRKTVRRIFFSRRIFSCSLHEVTTKRKKRHCQPWKSVCYTVLWISVRLLSPLEQGLWWTMCWRLCLWQSVSLRRPRPHPPLSVLEQKKSCGDKCWTLRLMEWPCPNKSTGVQCENHNPFADTDCSMLEYVELKVFFMFKSRL